MQVGTMLLFIIKTTITVWAILTGWIYAIVTNPNNKRKAFRKIRAVPIESKETEVTYKTTDFSLNELITEFKAQGSRTMAEAFDFAVDKYGSRRFLGTRDLLGEEDEVQPNGKLFRKQSLGDYRWMTYEDVDSLADNIGRGLRVLGQQPNENLCMFADTRAEWLITAQACFKQSFPVVTLYTNLGDEAVRHGVCETEVKTIITSHELLPKFRNILKDTPNVRRIIYFDNPIRSTDVTKFRDDVEIISFWDVVSLGKKTVNNNMPDVDVEPVYPSPSSPVIIMYTSGSTGDPKGVIITHENLLSAVMGFLTTMHAFKFYEADSYIAFLPLAHIFELILETLMALVGVGIGYSNPNTLTDKSSMIKRGHLGDATLLKPSFMACVPLILDRIYKAIPLTLKKKGEFVEKLFNFCVKYKLNAINNGEVTPIMDRLIFKTVTQMLGGRLRLIIAGGAPLSKDTHEYVKVVMGVPVLQGYGLTETAACATVMEPDDNSIGRVGSPVQGVTIRLINWEEGNYRVKDKPLPRGEILIGGKNVSAGYYKLPDKTDEEFFTDEEGVRWFKTGDIGAMELDGTLQIIDRKKDLVKLQFGEYVSLGKVESVLKTCPTVNDICIYGDSTKSYVVAMVCPDKRNLDLLTKKLGKQPMPLPEMVHDKDLTGSVLRELVNQSRKAGLQKFEFPGAVCLCKELWTPDSGLVTAAFKLKRKPIQDFYQKDIDRMYGV